MPRKRNRFLLIGATVTVAVFLLVLTVALNSSFQTWAVRRALADSPGVTIGRVDANFRSIELRDVRVVSGTARLTAPLITARLPLLPALWSQRVSVSRLEAAGWTLEVSETSVATSQGSTGSVAAAPSPASNPADVPASAATAGSGSPAIPAQPHAGFTGLFNSLKLPADLSLDALDIKGTVVVKPAAVTAHVTITGGNLGAGRDARIDVRADTALADATVTTLRLDGRVTARMDTPRTFQRLAATVRATATGPKLASHVSLSAELGATRDARAETYTIDLRGDQRKLLSILAEFPSAAPAINGTWRIDLRDADLSPFMLGRPLPTFAATGQGKIDADTSFAVVHATGQLDASVERLETIRPELGAIGAARLVADIDVARRGGALNVERLDVAISGAKPIATVRALQPFEFKPSTGELTPTDAARELIGIALHAVPLSWAKPFAPDFDFGGEDVRGELVATPRAGGFTFKSKTPLTIAGFSASRSGTPLLQGLDLSINTSGDYTPQGWQAEIAAVTARSGGHTVLMLGARAGALMSAGHRMKATGLLTMDLGALAAQPIAREAVALTKGDATIEFAANLAATREIDAKISLKNMVAGPASAPVSLPAVSGTVRADVAADGTWKISAPISVQNGERASDFNVYGTVAPRGAGHVFDAQLASKSVSVDDLRAFAAAFPTPPPSTAAAAVGQIVPPPWIGLEGSLTLNLGSVRYSDKLEMKNVTGKIRLSGGTLSVDDVRAGVGEGTARVSGALSFDAKAQKPFSVAADIELTDFDPGPLFLLVNPRQQPTVDGRFTASAHVRSTAAFLEELPNAAYGEFDLTSRTGTFRGLMVNVGNLVENSSKLASWLASAGNAITSIGRKDNSASDAEDIKSRSQAASELAKALSSIPYDQLNLIVVRDESLNTTVREFSLISPDIRVSGNGTARYVPGKSVVDDAVALDLRLRARGRPAELMKFLGVLDGKPDDLGYTSCTIPVAVGGTLANVDTTDLSNRLVALAVQKTGLTEKAVDWINRLRGK